MARAPEMILLRPNGMVERMREVARAPEMILLRPNGMVEPLYRSVRERPDLMTYGRAQPGPATAEAVRLAARQDRRKERRARPEPLRGRLVDVEA